MTKDQQKARAADIAQHLFAESGMRISSDTAFEAKVLAYDMLSDGRICMNDSIECASLKLARELDRIQQ